MLQLYKNIKKRRTELHLTQAELAAKLGYADKSMIAKIEKGLVDLPQSKILAFADTLQLSPSDLMGWGTTDEDIANVLVSDCLEDIIDNINDFSPSEKTHFKNYIHLLETNRKRVDNYTAQLLSLQQMDEEATTNAAHERTDITVTDEMRQHDDDIMNDENF